MSERPIDALARAMATGIDRRRLLAGLAIGLIHPIIAAPRPILAGGCKKLGGRCERNGDCCSHAECRGGECKCQSGWKECGAGKCVNRDNDESHCGACGVTCQENESCCDGTCTDRQVDSNNCGSCGNACADDELCSAGVCVVTRPIDRCSPTCVGRCCDGTCVDVQRDRDNCGSCGVACRQGGQPEVCAAGICVACPSRVVCGNACCAAGEACCDGACVDLDRDRSNCGRCGTICPPAHQCFSGHCLIT